MRRTTRIVLHLAPFLSVLINAGCSRSFFRNAADKDVEGVITEKNKFPDWDVKSWHVYPDPRSRFADVSNPDRPPYPPDDYAARVLSPNPQHPTKKTGTGRVDGDGYLKMLEEWNTLNRTGDRTDARGVSPDSMSGLILPKSETEDQATLPNLVGPRYSPDQTIIRRFFPWRELQKPLPGFQPGIHCPRQKCPLLHPL